jgi:hypothetical protein
MKFTTTGKSLLELRDIYGIDSGGFYNNTWWLDEPFAKEKSEAGVYEIDFKSKLTNLTFDEQVRKLKKGFRPIHPAILAEAVLLHYKTTGKRLLKDLDSRSNTFSSSGYHVSVGRFDSRGLDVDRWTDGNRFDYVGLAASRKLSSLAPRTIDPLETLPLELEINGIKYIKKFIN